MSTSPGTPSACAAGGSTAAQSHVTAGQRRGTGTPQAGGDLFSNLLSLLSADAPTPLMLSDLPARDGGAQPDAGPGDGSALTDGSHNPLAALLAWTGQPAPALASDALPTATDAPATGPLTETVLSRPGSDPLGAGSVAGADAAQTTHPRDRATGLLTAANVAQPPLRPGPPDGATAPAATPAVATPDTAPDHLAQAAAATANASPIRNGNGTTAHPATATRITTWRSTTTLASAGTPGSQPALSARLATRTAETAAVAQALAMATTDTPDSVDAAPPAGLLSGGERPALGVLPTGGSGTPGLTAGGSGEGSSSAGADAQPDTAAGAREAGDPLQPSADSDDAALAGWTSPHLRHAQVRVGEAGEDPIDIQLSLDGQEVQVRFQTSDALTRDSLAREAGAALGELLQRSGMELGSVSVGDPNAGSQQQAGGQGEHQAPPGAARRAEPAPQAEPVRPAPRQDGSRPLDLFV